MTEPETEAGRRPDWPHQLSHGIALKFRLSYEEALVLEAELRPAIERIEDEAGDRAATVRLFEAADRAAREARADLAARIEERVKQFRVGPSPYPDDPANLARLGRDEVIDLILTVIAQEGAK